MNIHKVMEYIGWAATGLVLSIGFLYAMAFIFIKDEEEDYDYDDCDDSSK